MKKAALIVATVAALSSTAVIAPAQARGFHHIGAGVAGAAVATAIAAGVAADAYYGYGPGYGYYAPGYVYAPGYAVYGPGIYRGWRPY